MRAVRLLLPPFRDDNNSGSASDSSDVGSSSGSDSNAPVASSSAPSAAQAARLAQDSKRFPRARLSSSESGSDELEHHQEYEVAGEDPAEPPIKVVIEDGEKVRRVFVLQRRRPASKMVVFSSPTNFRSSVQHLEELEAKGPPLRRAAARSVAMMTKPASPPLIFKALGSLLGFELQSTLHHRVSPRKGFFAESLEAWKERRDQRRQTHFITRRLKNEQRLASRPVVRLSPFLITYYYYYYYYYLI
jgi:hypothetical protein